jgi:hypothetical protein
MSRYYPKGIPKSSICPVVPYTSVVLFVERISGGPPSYVRTTDSNICPTDLAYICLLRVSVWLLFAKGSKCDLVSTKGFGSR